MWKTYGSLNALKMNGVFVSYGKRVTIFIPYSIKWKVLSVQRFVCACFSTLLLFTPFNE